MKAIMGWLCASFVLTALFVPAVSDASYPWIEVTSYKCTTQSQWVTVAWDDPSNPSPADYVEVGSAAFGWQPFGYGNSGQVTEYPITRGVEYEFVLFNSGGSRLAEASYGCQP